MTKEELIKKIDSKLKLIRNERNFTQDRMAEILGMSKKTLVQIEKGRGSLGWSGSVVVCSLFKDSEILKMTIGEDISDIISSIAFGHTENNYTQTMGGKLWWNTVDENTYFKIQKNQVSNHYRILNSEDKRICSSFDIDYIKTRFNELTKSKN
ncbi:helix-turn-helix domain-containing protein [Clostridium sp. B9]|uniref:helix-turn-helix domain-containing protein n=1 Tax=Clostridium sp. B9 TaxID=3423224 RepID=UPI003D2EEA31